MLLMSSDVVMHAVMPLNLMSHMLSQSMMLNLTSRGIKQDASLFTILKDPKKWDSWH